MSPFADRSLAGIRALTHEGVWSQATDDEITRYTDGVNEGSIVFGHTAPDGTITILQAIALITDPTDPLPFTGSYARYLAIHPLLDDQQLLAAHIGIDTYAMSDRVTQCALYFEAVGEDAPQHSWPEGYATLRDLMDACGIPVDALRNAEDYQ